jgi:hypothetical protein
MFPSDRYFRSILLMSGLFMMTSVLPVSAAMDASFELDPRTLGVSTASKNTVKSDSRPNRRRMVKSSATAAVEGVVHIIKPGDNLFKILMQDYGLSNDEAETFIEVICRENNIADIRHLKIGRKIVIPPLRRRGDGTIKGVYARQTVAVKSMASGQILRLNSPETALSELEASAQIRETWNKLLPPPAGGQKPIMLQSSTFSLTLDPQRYPVYAAMDNGKILIDMNASIPTLVKTLITEKDPSVRIVSESPLNRKRFLSAMLDSAGFYSVEENFSMDFGSDPKLTIHSDFKIEKTPESLIKQDLLLMNAGHSPYPGVIREFLKKEGVTVYEPFASTRSAATAMTGRLYQVTSKKQSDMIDVLLSSISIIPDKDRRLDVFAADNNGISLSVKADRYFERGGQRYVVASFDGNPITYTLYRILETKGYQVAILEAKDDFRKVSEKLLSCLHVPGTYAQHELTHDTGAGYSLHMSGFKFESPDFPVAGVFLTNLELDRVIRDILAEDGYSIITK